MTDELLEAHETKQSPQNITYFLGPAGGGLAGLTTSPFGMEQDNPASPMLSFPPPAIQETIKSSFKLTSVFIPLLGFVIISPHPYVYYTS
jgi:hypothetical protein